MRVVHLGRSTCHAISGPLSSSFGAREQRWRLATTSPQRGGRIAFIRTTSRRIQASANTIKDLKKTIRSRSALKATQGQTDGFLSQLPYKFHVEEVTSMGY